MAIFLRENGVLTMGNKTPVTILQEMLQRRGLNPQYELIYNGVGTMDPLFKFQVSAAGLTAIGDGKSKKEAKHDAAATLLKRMQENRTNIENPEVETTEELDIASPYSGALKQNFVGMLDETCVVNKIPLPVYIPIREEGPPHARVFTMQCRVSTCTETAVARTKKQAKHMVAQQMIKRVSQILGESYISPADRSVEVEGVESLCGNFRQDLSVPLADLQSVFYHRTEEFLVPKSFIDLPNNPDEFYEQMEKPKDFLDELIEGLGGTCRIIQTSLLGLRDTLQEIEKDCQLFCWDQEESSDEEHDENGETGLCSDSDNESYLHKYVLEEFNLENTDESRALPSHSSNVENNTKSNTFTKVNNDLELDNQLSKSSLGDFEDNISKINEMQISLKLPDNALTVKSFLLFLSLECPQGTWAFRGLGETHEGAVNYAAVQALKFFRALAVPNYSKKSV